MSREIFSSRLIIYLTLLSTLPVSTWAQDRISANMESGAVDLDQLEAEILTSTSDEARNQLLGRFLEFANSEEYFSEFAIVAERLILRLPEAEGDRVAYSLSVAQERHLSVHYARETVAIRALNGGGADTEWGFLLRYRNALLATKQRDYETAATIFESLYSLGDEVISEHQQGRLRRQLTDTYRQLGRWEDVVRMGEEARVFTSDDDEKILGVLYHLGTAYSSIGEFDAAARVLNELAERVNHFYPDEASRRTGAALGYVGVEEWAVRAQAIADAQAEAENGPVRVAVAESLEQLRENMEADGGEGEPVPTDGAALSDGDAPGPSARIANPSIARALPKEVDVTNPSPDGPEQGLSGGTRLILPIALTVLLLGGVIMVRKRRGEGTASASRR